MLFYSTTLDGLQMGLCFAVLSLGMYISYAILDFPDLTVDSTFPLGGVCCTILMLRLGVPALPAILLSFVAGFAAGAVTGFLHVRCRITKLLSAIIVMTGLLSVTLALTSLLSRNGQTTTIFSYRSENLVGLFNAEWIKAVPVAYREYVYLAILAVIVLAIKGLLDLFLKTKLGYMLRATGNNESLVVSLGKDVGAYKILGLALANGIVAVSGALYANLYMQYDNTSGSGKVVLSLASVIIGLAVFARIPKLKDTTAVIFGALVYSLCLNYLSIVDRNGIYLKLLNALLFALILVFNEKLSTFRARGFSRKGAST